MSLTDHDLARFRRLSASQLSDAMEGLGLRRSVIAGFRFLGRDDAVMVGTACTVRQVPKHHPAAAGERLVRHDEVSRTLAAPGQIVVVDAGGRTDVAAWGENHSIRCRDRGVAGALINGSTRDTAAIARSGFPVFCRGASPISSRWDMETAGLDVPVVVEGVTIRPGDIVFGDADGVIVIPPACKDEVLVAALRQAGIDPDRPAARRPSGDGS